MTFFENLIGLTRNYSTYLTVEQLDVAHKIEKKMMDVDFENSELLKDDKFKKGKLPFEESYIKTAQFRFKSSRILLTYIGIKFLYLFVAIFQIYLMNAFLSTKKNDFYGSEIVSSILNGDNEIHNNTDSKIFPR